MPARSMLRTADSGPSILSGPFDVIDDEEVAGPPRWLKFQPEPLYSAKDRWAGGFRGRVDETCHIAAREVSGCGCVGRKFQLDIKLPRDSGLVDDRAV